MQKVNLAEKLAQFSDQWKPKTVGELNGQQVKLVKFQGPFVWHHHDNEDEMFLVVKGRFRMEFRDRHVWLEEGEFLIVPRGVEHRPVADEQAHVLLFEPASTLNTGNMQNERTVANLEPHLTDTAQPRPTRNANMVNYDTIAEEYARHRQVNPEVLRSIIETTRISSSSKILEVGCGTGNYITALERAVGCACWGIDPSEKMLATARGKSPTIHLQTGMAERLDFGDDSLDLVFSVDVIHHVVDRAAFFREAFRVLRPGGQVWTVTDSEEIIRHRQPLAVYFPEIVEVELARYPSVSEMRRLMEKAGFGQMAETVVEFPFQVTNVAAYRDKAFSSLHFIPADAHRRGIERMEHDLRQGPIQGNSRYYMLRAAKGVEE